MPSPLPPRQSKARVARLGEKLRALREARAWTQEAVARAAGYQQHSAYTKLETGAARRPTAAAVLTLARLYEVSVDALLRDELELPPDALRPSS